MSLRVLLVSIYAFGALSLLAAAPAQACCTPCFYLCDTAPPSTYCCSGIPEPGNACGFMTCGEYNGEAETSLVESPSWLSTSATGTCATTSTEVQPAEGETLEVEAIEAQATAS